METKKNTFYSMVQIMLLNIKKWTTSYRVYMVLPIVFIFTDTRARTVRQFLAESGLSISNWYPVFQFSSPLDRMFFYFGLVMLLCNAPFVDNHQMFVISRCGRKAWIGGQIMYIFATTVLYFLLIALMGMLLCIPYLGFTWDWESAVYSIIADKSCGYTGISDVVVSHYEPLQAFLLTYGLNIAIGFFLGLLILLINMQKWKINGSVVAIVIIIIADIVRCCYYFFPWLYYISPVSWGSLSVFVAEYGTVTLTYAVSFLGIGIFLLLIGIVKSASKYGIEAVEK